MKNTLFELYYNTIIINIMSVKVETELEPETNIIEILINQLVDVLAMEALTDFSNDLQKIFSEKKTSELSNKSSDELSENISKIFIKKISNMNEILTKTIVERFNKKLYYHTTIIIEELKVTAQEYLDKQKQALVVEQNKVAE